MTNKLRLWLGRRHPPCAFRLLGQLHATRRQGRRVFKSTRDRTKITAVRTKNGSHDEINESGMPDRRLGHDRRKDDECGLYTCPAYHSVSVTSQLKVSEHISKVRTNKAEQQHSSSTAVASEQVTTHTTILRTYPPYSRQASLDSSDLITVGAQHRLTLPRQR